MDTFISLMVLIFLLWSIKSVVQRVGPHSFSRICVGVASADVYATQTPIGQVRVGKAAPFGDSGGIFNPIQSSVAPGQFFKAIPSPLTLPPKRGGRANKPRNTNLGS